MNARLLTVAIALAAPLASSSAIQARGALDPQIAAMVAAVSSASLRSTDDRLVAFGTRNLFSEQTSTPQRGVFAARDWIAAQFERIAASSGGRMTVSLDTYQLAKTDRIPRDVTVSSVIAVLKGDDPAGRTYIMSSHYDSRNSDGNDPIKDAPGADDNGSGTSAVLEAARVMAPHRFRATIIFACFDGEEQGLFGSDHYARTLKAAGVNVAGNVNNDIIGASVGPHGERASRVVRLFSESLPAGADAGHINLLGSENDSPSRELARFVKAVAEEYVPPMQAELIYREDRFLRGGDQESFAAQGFPAVRFVEKYENYDHQHQDIRLENGIQYGDLQRFEDFDYLARVTKMNVAALAALALGPAAPDAKLVTKTLGYDSTLRWKAVPGAVSYEVVWRATSAPLWQFSRNVGNVTQVTLPISKDDFVLGVRAVDASGHRSVATYPPAVRE
jgi:Zn-dependent M28 family amino/carboxypeptidase